MIKFKSFVLRTTECGRRTTVVFAIVGLCAGAALISGCAEVMKQINQMATLAKCEFRLASVDHVNLAGISIRGEKTSLGFSELAKAQAALFQGTLPLTFNLNLEVRNPNSSPAGLNGIEEWTFYLDGDPLLTSTKDKSFDKPLEVAPDGGVGTLPLMVVLDLNKVLNGKTLDSMVNLALNIAGQGTKPTRLALDLKPSITVKGRTLVYPGSIRINQDFSSK